MFKNILRRQTEDAILVSPLIFTRAECSVYATSIASRSHSCSSFIDGLLGTDKCTSSCTYALVAKKSSLILVTKHS